MDKLKRLISDTVFDAVREIAKDVNEYNRWEVVHVAIVPIDHLNMQLRIVTVEGRGPRYFTINIKENA